MTKRKLIEVALPLEAINIASAREKSIRRGHPSTLHLWWARRPLATCRAVLFASLVDDPSSDPDHFPTLAAVEDERTRLFGIIERLVRWESSTDEAVLEEARAEIRHSMGGSPPPVLDPFCGGGSIPLEAQRLGLSAYASDLNPVAVFITKALVEIPPKFRGRPPVHPDGRRGVGGTGSWNGTGGLAEDVRRYGAWLRDEAERRIGQLYPTIQLPPERGGGEAIVIAWLWARTVTCPNPACGASMPLVRSFELSTRSGKEAWVEPIVDREVKTVQFSVRSGSGPRPQGTVGRNGAHCVVCRTAVPLNHIRAEGRAGRIGAQLMAVVAEGERSRIYLSPTTDQTEAADAALSEWSPGEDLPDNPRDFKTPNYGMRTFADLFTARQLVALATASDLVGEARELVLRDARNAGVEDDGTHFADGGTGATAYADGVAAYLACAVDRCSDYWSTITTWHSGRELIRNTFSRQAIPMTWDYTEVNPFSGSTGSLDGAIRWVSDVVEVLPAHPDARVLMRDAAEPHPIQVAPAISTDPPYYDNIGYADLSDYFYVWLRRMMQGVFPELFRTLMTPKTAELVATPYRFEGDQAAADAHFESGLGEAFRLMRETADPEIPITIYYAFKQTETDGEGPSPVGSTGWETMLEALLGAGLSVEGTWPMRSELGNRMMASGTNALASSIVLVCRMRVVDAGITTRKEFVAALKRELPDALRTLQHGSIAPVDLAQASIGPGMAVFSRYAKVLEPDGAAMRVRMALALINQALDELLTEQEGEFDAGTRWAIAWYEQFGLKDAEFGMAETLSKAKNTSISGLADAGILAASRGRVRLLAREEYATNWDPLLDGRVPVWEATQHLIRTLLVDGESGAAQLLARLGGVGDVARDLAYRLYNVADRKGWTADALAYNALVVSWPDLVRGAEDTRRSQPAQASLELES